MWSRFAKVTLAVCVCLAVFQVDVRPDQAEAVSVEQIIRGMEANFAKLEHVSIDYRIKEADNEGEGDAESAPADFTWVRWGPVEVLEYEEGGGRRKDLWDYNANSDFYFVHFSSYQSGSPWYVSADERGMIDSDLAMPDRDRPNPGAFAFRVWGWPLMERLRTDEVTVTGTADIDGHECYVLSASIKERPDMGYRLSVSPEQGFFPLKIEAIDVLLTELRNKEELVYVNDAQVKDYGGAWFFAGGTHKSFMNYGGVLRGKDRQCTLEITRIEVNKDEPEYDLVPRPADCQGIGYRPKSGKAWWVSLKSDGSNEELEGLWSVPAPALAITRWMNTEPLRLADFFGKKDVVLAFWSIRCPPCVGQLDEMKELYEQCKSSDAMFIAVHDGDPGEDLDKFVGDRGVAFPVAVDGQGKTFEHYRVREMPFFGRIGRNGGFRELGTPIQSSSWKQPDRGSPARVP